MARAGLTGLPRLNAAELNARKGGGGASNVMITKLRNEVGRFLLNLNSKRFAMLLDWALN